MKSLGTGSGVKTVYSGLLADIPSGVPNGSFFQPTDYPGNEYKRIGDQWVQVSSGGAGHVAEVGIPSQRHNRYISGVDVVVPGPAVIATDVITLGTALSHAAGDAILLSGTDFTEATGQSLDGVQLILSAPDTTHMTLDDGSGTVVDIDATGTATGLAALVKKMTFTQAENVRRYRILAIATSGGGHMKWVEDAANSQQAGTWLLDPTSSESKDLNHQRAEDGVWTEWQELSKNPDDDSLSNLYFAGDNTAGAWEIYVETE